MKQTIIYLILLIFSLSSITCGDKDIDEVIDDFTVSPSKIDFPRKGGKTEIQVTYSGLLDWKIQSTVDWCRYYYDLDLKKRYIIAESNTTSKARVTKLEIVREGQAVEYLVVSQEGGDATELKISVDRIDILSTGTSERFEITANGSWRVSDAPEWCKISPIEYWGTFGLVTASAKVLDSAREGSLAINYGASKITVPIKQWSTVDAYLLNTAGELNNTLYNKKLYNTIEKLKLKGKLNSSDYNTFRDIVKLRKLDVSEIEFASGVAKLPPFFARNCFKLETVILPPKIVVIGDNAFMACSLLENIEIPESVESIEMSAFNGCKISKITLPSRLSSIGVMAFGKCPLKTVQSKNSTPPVIALGAFDPQIYTTCILRVPKGSKSRYQSANHWFRFENIVEE